MTSKIRKAMGKMIKSVHVMVAAALAVWASVGICETYKYSANGRYLLIEPLSKDVVRFEVGAKNTGAATNILNSAMISTTDLGDPPQGRLSGNTVTTQNLRVTVNPSTLCVDVQDTKRNQSLGKICPGLLEQDWKNLLVESPSTQNIYGLGQYFEGPLSTDGDWNHRAWDPLADGFGSRLRGYNGGANNMSMFPIAYFLGSGRQNFAMFVDSIYKQMWDFRQTPWNVGMWGDQIRFYMIAGDNLVALRKTYMQLTGRPPVPPKNVFGLWVSQFGFKSWDEIQERLKTLRQAKFPVDGFGMDLQWFGGTFGDPDHSRMGSLQWDERAFPSPAAHIAALNRDDGVQLMLIEEPYIANNLPEHQDLAAKGFLVKDCQGCAPTFLNSNPWWGRGGMVDYTNPEAGKYWHSFRRHRLAQMGVRVHWLDLGEPEQYNSNAWYYGFPEIEKHAHVDVHNIYASKWVESLYKGYKDNIPDQRTFILSRSGTSGIQRFGAALWSGDTGTDWGNLRTQQRVQRDMSMSGVDYYGSDVGGFQRAKQVSEGTLDSLYTAWLANSALFDVPVRPHAWNLDHALSTSPADRGDVASNLANVRLRYELLPYLYSLAHIASRTGEPIFPPAVAFFQEDSKLRSRGDLKMLGPSLLARTVTQADQLTEEMYLPKGKWCPYFFGHCIKSEGETIAAFPIYINGVLRLPLFAREGSIVPFSEVDDLTMNASGRRRDQSKKDSLSVKVFPGTVETKFTYYEDDGVTNAHLSGRVATTEIRASKDNAKIRVSFAPTSGIFNGQPATRAIHLDVKVNDQKPSAVTLNNFAIPFCETDSEWETQGECWRERGEWVNIKTKTQQKSGIKNFEVAVSDAVATTSAMFQCRNASVVRGTTVFVSGSVPALGGWKTESAVELRPVGTTTTWSGVVSGLPAGMTILWKCFQKGTKVLPPPKDVQWEPGPNHEARLDDIAYSGAYTGQF